MSARLSLPVVASGAVAVVGLWFVAPLLAPIGIVRPALAGVLLVAAMVEVARTAAYTAGVERRGWLVMVVCAIGCTAPYVGTTSGSLIGIGVLLTCGRGWLRDRWRVLDAAVAIATVSALAVAYLVPAVLAHQTGWSQVDALIGTAEIVLAVSAMLLLSYRASPRARSDTWLVGSGFCLAVAAASEMLLSSRNGAWIPVHWWDLGLALGAWAILAGARLRRQRPERELPALTGGSPQRHAAILGDVWLLALLVALAFAPTDLPVATVAVALAVVVLRNLRARRVEHEHRDLTEQRIEHLSALDGHRRSQLEALSAAMAARDGYTSDHGDETLSLVREIATATGMDAHTQIEVETVALLHHIGKIGIPDAILNKPGPLDESEWLLMREHPVIGERILRAIPGHERVALAVRHEHERYDGTGYPDRIAGTAIPLASRIVLVCDAYHAMTSDRPYRQSIGHDLAVAELRHCAGTQFDPVVVDALITALAERGAGGAPAAPAAARTLDLHPTG